MSWSDDKIIQTIDITASMFGLKPQPVKSDDIRPKPFITQIPLVDAFERLHRVKADRCQRDLCRRLQEAKENQHELGTRAIIHIQSQFGKSVICSQVFPVWIFGHVPTSRFALLTYNETNSQKHSAIALAYMQSLEYKELFPNKDGWIPKSVSVKRWSTYGRMDMRDGQPSYNALGLQSGFTGNSAEDVFFDDPYKNLEEALSDTVRPKIESKWLNMTIPRITEYTNVYGMFHRYFHEDFAGYLLSTPSWRFDYWRYASICDGDFIDKKTGRIFSDPLNREPGEYLSHRFGEEQYKNARQYPQLWASQYQGRPDAEDGGFFDVDKLIELDGDAYTQKAKEVVRWVRSWDNAATDEGGAFTVGSKVGITSEGDFLIDDLERKQVSTGKRLALQLETAEKDGKEVPATIPNDPGGAGTDVVFLTKQKFAEKGFELFDMSTSNDKEMRARPMAQEVSASKVYYKKAWWNSSFLTEFEQFPLSLFKDIVDSTADAVRFLLKLVEKGNVISYFDQSRTLVSWQSFAAKFGKKIPHHWKLYVAIRYNDNKSIPSGAVLIARAAENARIGEKLFLVGCYKDSKLDFGELVNWLETFIPAVVEVKNNKLPDMKLILNKEAEHLLPVIRRKLKMSFSLFSGDEVSGIYETNWYMKPITGKQHAFNPGQLDTSFYWLCAAKQLEKAENEYGLLSARQEANNWTYREKNKPQEFGGIVLDAVRMVLSQFRTHATPLTHTEKFFDYLSKTAPDLMPEIQTKIQNTDRLAEIELARTVVRKEWEQKNNNPDTIESDWGKHVAENEEENFELL